MSIMNEKNLGMPIFPIRLLITFLILAIILMIIILGGLFLSGLATILATIGAFLYGLVKGIVSLIKRRKGKEGKGGKED